MHVHHAWSLNNVTVPISNWKQHKPGAEKCGKYPHTPVHTGYEVLDAEEVLFRSGTLRFPPASPQVTTYEVAVLFSTVTKTESLRPLFKPLGHFSKHFHPK